jgi:hypothetical protein
MRAKKPAAMMLSTAISSSLQNLMVPPLALPEQPQSPPENQPADYEQQPGRETV